MAQPRSAQARWILRVTQRSLSIHWPSALTPSQPVTAGTRISLALTLHLRRWSRTLVSPTDQHPPRRSAPLAWQPTPSPSTPSLRQPRSHPPLPFQHLGVHRVRPILS